MDQISGMFTAHKIFIFKKSLMKRNACMDSLTLQFPEGSLHQRDGVLAFVMHFPY